jgi:hypothetical protein
MYLWVLGPIYLLYILRHGRGYLRMSRLFKVKMVAVDIVRLELNNVGEGAGGNLVQEGSSYLGTHRVDARREPVHQTDQY